MKYAIIVPTMGLEHLKFLVQSVIGTWRGSGILILSFNAKDVTLARNTEKIILPLLQEAQENTEIDFSWSIIFEESPLGFGGAVNQGLQHVKNNFDWKSIDQFIILNDDCIVTDGWVQGLQNGHNTKYAQTAHQSMVGTEQTPIETLGGKVGIVGPCSFFVAGDQNVHNKGNEKAFQQMGLEEFARSYKLQVSNLYLRTDFLSGFVMSISKECLESVLIPGDTIQLFDEQFKIGGFEDNDLCVRTILNGYQMLIVRDTYIHHLGHLSFEEYYPEAQVGLHNRQTYFDKWKDYTQRDQKLVAAYRIAIKCVNDLAQFRSSIKRAINVGIKGFAILLTNDPRCIFEAYDKGLIHSLPPEEKKFVEELVKCRDQESVIEKFEDYITILTGYVEANLGYTDWKSFNERDERNRTHELAEEMKADWIISIDSDEVIEDRITKYHIEKLMKHPDPLVSSYHMGWINHWESMNLVRTDKPFTSGRDLKSSMVGPRMWRVRPNALRIVSGTSNGLHCGNAPEYSAGAARISYLRFRHLSHVRGIDRLAKKQFYDQIDQEKNPLLIGIDNNTSSYNHIVQADDITVQIYNPANGICGFMLCYEEEDEEMIAQKLDIMYANCDYLILVWTSKEEKSEKLLSLADHYKVIWLHHEFDPQKGLAESRNEAVEYIRKNLLQKGVSWCLFYDPDESIIESNHVHNASIRRCAEQNDSWGFMITYKNKLPQGSTLPYSTSSSIRMFRVDPQGIMRFSGRVHESLDDSVAYLQKINVDPKIQAFPYHMLNLGLSKGPEAMANKLRKYTEMLISDLEQNPLRPQCWLALGLQYVNEEDMEKAEICLERACMTAGGAYMPFKELATIQLNKALAYIIKAKQRLNGGESVFWPGIDQLIESIRKASPPHPIINTGPENIIQDIPLPNFPYDRIMIDEAGEFQITNNLDEQNAENGDKIQS